MARAGSAGAPPVPETNRDIYGEVESKSDLKEVFSHIRGDVAKADKRPDLTELYKRAGYLVTLTYSPSWKEKFGSEASELRSLAEEEFGKTADRINSHAKAIGVEPDYDTKWGT